MHLRVKKIARSMQGPMELPIPPFPNDVPQRQITNQNTLIELVFLFFTNNQI